MPERRQAHLPVTSAAGADRPGPLQRLAGAAGLAFVLGVAIENMAALQAPTLASSAADIRAQYADHAFAVVTSFAGAVALATYALFAAALFVLLREREHPGEVWSAALLAGGIAGPVMAAAGLGATGVLVANGGANLSDDVVTALFDLHLVLRMLSGVFVALFLVGVGVGALRSRALPRWLAWYACALAAPMALAPLAALTAEHALGVAVTIAFGLQTLWLFMMSLWLGLGDGLAPVTFVRRAAFLVLVLAAGLIGIAMLVVPAATAKFFAWGLGPEPLAAFAGGVYVGSAAAYAVGIPRPERDVRGLLVGAVVLSVSVFLITLTHLDQFDFDRLQAWVWLALFAGFSVITTGVLLVAHRERVVEPNAEATARPAPWARLLFALVSALLGALAVALWIDPGALTSASPFDLSPLGGRFAGSWVALLAVLSGWAALQHRAQDARLSALAILTLPAGALIGALRTISDLEPTGAAVGYLGVLVALLACGAVLLGSLRRRA